jgi:hypothetical protein
MFRFARCNPLIYIDPAGTQSRLIEGLKDAFGSLPSLATDPVKYNPTESQVSPYGELDPGDPPRLFLPYSDPSQHIGDARGNTSLPEGYDGIGGWLHYKILEPAQRDYYAWTRVGPNLASSWGDKVPVLGHLGGYVVGVVPGALGLIGRAGTGLLQFFIPKTEEEQFVFIESAGLGAGLYRAATAEREVGETAERVLAGQSSASLSGTASEAAANAGDHIVLGLRAGLKETAAKVGGRTLLQDSEWRVTLKAAVQDPSTKFTVSLDGMSGSSTIEQVYNAVQRGERKGAWNTDWEMRLLYLAGRLADATFVRGGVAVPNPFAK